MLVLSVMEPRLRADFETGEYLRSRPNSWKVTSGPGIVRKVSTLATGLSPRWNFQRCLKNMFVCELRGNVLSRRVSLTAKYVDTHRHRLVRLFIVPQLTMIGHFKRASFEGRGCDVNMCRGRNMQQLWQVLKVPAHRSTTTGQSPLNSTPLQIIKETQKEPPPKGRFCSEVEVWRCRFNWLLLSSLSLKLLASQAKPNPASTQVHL